MNHQNPSPRRNLYPDQNGRRTPSPNSRPRRNLSPAQNGRRTPSPNGRQRRSTQEDISRPLLEREVNASGPPLAGPETDTESDDRETVNKLNPGVDDGFFTTSTETPNPDVETIPLTPQPEAPHSPNPRDNPNFGHFPANPGRSHPGNGRRDSNFPYAPGFGPEIGNIPERPQSEFNPLGESIPDVNYYQQKKTLAQGMMDIALFSANANQLRYVLESYDRHPYYYPSVAFIGISLIIQVSSIIFLPS